VHALCDIFLVWSRPQLGLIDVALASCNYSLINIPAVFLSTNICSRSQSDWDHKQ